MEENEMMEVLADIERRRIAMRQQMDELAHMQFWLFALLGMSVFMLGGSLIWLTGCALARLL